MNSSTAEEIPRLPHRGSYHTAWNQTDKPSLHYAQTPAPAIALSLSSLAYGTVHRFPLSPNEIPSALAHR